MCIEYIIRWKIFTAVQNINTGGVLSSVYYSRLTGNSLRCHLHVINRSRHSTRLSCSTSAREKETILRTLIHRD